ncbi:hypothetical protein ACTXT7_010900, partial [Hymenolepis weldensis]
MCIIKALLPVPITEINYIKRAEGESRKEELLNEKHDKSVILDETRGKDLEISKEGQDMIEERELQRVLDLSVNEYRRREENKEELKEDEHLEIPETEVKEADKLEVIEEKERKEARMEEEKILKADKNGEIATHEAKDIDMLDQSHHKATKEKKDQEVKQRKENSKYTEKEISEEEHLEKAEEKTLRDDVKVEIAEELELSQKEFAANVSEHKLENRYAVEQKNHDNEHVKLEKPIASTLPEISHEDNRVEEIDGGAQELEEQQNHQHIKHEEVEEAPQAQVHEPQVAVEAKAEAEA